MFLLVFAIMALLYSIVIQYLIILLNCIFVYRDMDDDLKQIQIILKLKRVIFVWKDGECWGNDCQHKIVNII